MMLEASLFFRILVVLGMVIALAMPAVAQAPGEEPPPRTDYVTAAQQ